MPRHSDILTTVWRFQCNCRLVGICPKSVDALGNQGDVLETTKVHQAHTVVMDVNYQANGSALIERRRSAFKGISSRAPNRNNTAQEMSRPE